MKRIQRKRTKGWRKPENCIYAGRGSRWGNPYKIGEYEYSPATKQNISITKENCLTLFKYYAEFKLIFEPDWLEPLRSADSISCWCKEDSPCHVDVIIELLEDKDEEDVD